MRKILSALVVTLALASVGWGQQIPGVNVNEPNVGDTGYTVTRNVVDSGFALVSTIIDTALDTGYFKIEVYGYAKLYENQSLYLGLGNDSANRVDSATSATTGQAHSNLDTLILQAPDNMEGFILMPFYLTEIVTTGSATVSVIDTFYLNAASKTGKPIVLNNLKFQVSTVYDNN